MNVTEKETPVRTSKPTRQIDPDLTDKIELISTDLFIRNGYHGVSYLSIAKELGITHSSIHYYYRTKSALAEAVLKRFAADTLVATERIWTDSGTSLFEKTVAMRDWIYQSYLRFNPDGKGGRPWGLLARFTMEADALTSEMRHTIRSTLGKLDDYIETGVRMAVERGELEANTPVEGVSLQLSSVMYLTGQLTRHAFGFSRLDELLMFTIRTLGKAWGAAGRLEPEWPAPHAGSTSQA